MEEKDVHVQYGFFHYGNGSLNTETSLKEKIEQKSTQLQHWQTIS